MKKNRSKKEPGTPETTRLRASSTKDESSPRREKKEKKAQKQSSREKLLSPSPSVEEDLPPIEAKESKEKDRKEKRDKNLKKSQSGSGL